MCGHQACVAPKYEMCNANADRFKAYSTPCLYGGRHRSLVCQSSPSDSQQDFAHHDPNKTEVMRLLLILYNRVTQQTVTPGSPSANYDPNKRAPAQSERLC